MYVSLSLASCRPTLFAERSPDNPFFFRLPDAGTEYGSQCLCGNTIRSGTTSGKTSGKASTSCTMRCSGDASQICGGSYAASVYTKSVAVSPAKAWSATQCVADDSDRLLKDYGQST